MPSREAVSMPPLTSDTLRLAGTMVLLVRALDQELRKSEEAPLSITELGVLGQIDRGVCLPSQIARALRLDPARVTNVTDRLVRWDYLVREPDPEDRRCWRLRLTPQGRARLEAGRTDVRGALERVLGGLSSSERTGLLEGLEGVRRLLDAQLAPRSGKSAVSE